MKLQCEHPDGVATATDVRQELLSGWLQRFRWDVFLTGTLARSPKSSETAFALFGRWLKVMETVASRARCPGAPFRWARKPYAAAFQEVGPLTGRNHLHALVGNLDPIPAYCGVRLDLDDLKSLRARHSLLRCCVLHSWNHYGIARSVDYDPEKGASHYVTKYACKESSAGDWRIFGEFEPAGCGPLDVLTWSESLNLVKNKNSTAR